MKKEKKKKPFIVRLIGFIFSVVLVVVLLAAAAVGHVYFYMKGFDIQTAELQELAQREPMDPADRFTAYPDELSLGVNYEISDVAYLLALAGYDDAFVNDQLESLTEGTGITVDGWSVTPTARGIALDAAGYYRGIRVAATGYVNIRLTESNMEVYPTGVKIAGIYLSSDRIKQIAKIDITEYSYKLPAFTPTVLEQIDDVIYKDGCVEFKGRFNTSLIDLLTKSVTNDLLMCHYADGRYNISHPAAVYEEDADEGVRLMLSGITGDYDFGDFLKDYSILADKRKIRHLYSNTYGLWENRYVPGLDVEDILAERNRLEETALSRRSLMIKLFKETFAAWKSGTLKVADGKFLYKGNPFRASDLVSNWGDYGFVDEATVVPCIVTIGDADTVGLSALSSRMDTTDSFSAVVFPEKKYSVGLVFEAKDGSHVMLYSTYGRTERNGYIRAYREATTAETKYQQLLATGKVLVL